jgi:uncharacterized protein involved in outer membrane biogenesis
MPQYQISLAGKTAAEIETSVTGSGRMEINDGRVPKLDILQQIQSSVGALTGGGGGASGRDTNFSTMGLNFAIGGRKVNLTDILIKSAESRMTGAGTVTFDQGLNMNLQVVVGGATGAALGKLDRSGQSELTVPATVAGNTSNPVVKVQVGNLMKDRGIKAATGILDSFLKKKK